MTVSSEIRSRPSPWRWSTSWTTSRLRIRRGSNPSLTQQHPPTSPSRCVIESSKLKVSCDLSFFEQAHILLDCGDDNICKPHLKLAVRRCVRRQQEHPLAPPIWNNPDEPHLFVSQRSGTDLCGRRQRSDAGSQRREPGRGCLRGRATRLPAAAGRLHRCSPQPGGGGVRALGVLVQVRRFKLKLSDFCVCSDSQQVVLRLQEGEPD